ncbi:thiamine phosphate synthase [Pseudoblastomonas halimionae]|uniref:Thiamine phosphate synthase n=1 Tax=Alteriqipengyuania halimionae TaxID=1926630 RepID=A0A6I4U3W1_9SPHN|nr:thiamine phosphate synthase [Alteriqipengyuania halimionae]MXP10628.1 thiamine phosphate synthase [Alteriqipengyuania halimionae]
MAARYSVPVTTGQPLPFLWILSDARNDAQLEGALDRLPAGSGFVFRHYHLDPAARRERFDLLARRARARGHMVIVSRGAESFAQADGTYGRDRSAGRGLYLATAHNAAEIDAAERAGADGVFLSPVFATRSHERGDTLGPAGFHMLAQGTSLPVIALGGMTPDRAAEIDWPRWGAIDGLS